MRYFIIFMFVLLSFNRAFSQVQVGIYHSGTTGQVGVGTDLEKKFFGELRFMASDRLELSFGAEGVGQYNFYRSESYNIHGGLMLGYYGDVALGLPVGITIKPFSTFQRLGVLMEATPYLLGSQGFLRGNLGLRMRIGGDD